MISQLQHNLMSFPPCHHMHDREVGVVLHFLNLPQQEVLRSKFAIFSPIGEGEKHHNNRLGTHRNVSNEARHASPLVVVCMSSSVSSVVKIKFKAALLALFATAFPSLV